MHSPSGFVGSATSIHVPGCAGATGFVQASFDERASIHCPEIAAHSALDLSFTTVPANVKEHPESEMQPVWSLLYELHGFAPTAVPKQPTAAMQVSTATFTPFNMQAAEKG
jgi:hypothetical protein